jgi:hypothetical protein
VITAKTPPQRVSFSLLRLLIAYYFFSGIRESAAQISFGQAKETDEGGSRIPYLTKKIMSK